MKRTNMAAAGALTSRGLFALALVSLLTLCLPAMVTAARGAKAVPGRLLVGLRSPVSKAQVGTMQAETRGKVSRAIAGGQVLVMEFSGDADAAAAYAKLAGQPGVAFVERDTMVYPTLVPNDPEYPDQYHWPIIRAPEAWGLTTGGADVVIGVVDTGCDLDHPDFVGRIYTNPLEVPSNGIDDDSNGFIDDVHGWDFQNGGNDPNPEPDGGDDDGNGEPDDQVSHGTLVSGIACATGNNGWGVVGMNWGAKILPVQVFPDDGGSSVSRVIEGIDYAVGMGVDIINLSLGGSYAASFTPAIANARAHGILVVAAAGNTGRELKDAQSTWESPVCNEGTVGVDNNVFGVGATDQNDILGSFSNFDGSSARTFVECCAPGQAIYGPAYYDPTYSHLNSYFYSNTGTSFAAPMVSGLAAMILSQNPALTPNQVRSIIKSSCDDIDVLNPGFEGKLGAGRINAARAVGVELAPRPPRDVAASDTDGDEGGSVTVAWLLSLDDGAGSNSVTGYVVRRRRGASGAFAAVGNVPAGGTEYVDAAVTDGVNYYYQVRATDGTLNSDAVTVGPVQSENDNPPVRVAGLRVFDTPSDDGGSVTLRWDGYTAPADFDHFNVYRSNSQFVNLWGLTPLTTVANSSAVTFVDNAVLDGAEYYYAVGAEDQFGNEAKNVSSVGPVQAFANGNLNLAAGLHFFGPPVAPVDPDAAAFLGVSPDQLQLARWYAASSRYGYYSPTNRIRLSLGRGCWLKTGSPLSIVPNGTPAPAGDFTVKLTPGWQQLANPFFGATDLALATVTYQGTTMDLASADAANIMRRIVWRYDSADNAYRLIAPGLGLGSTVANPMEGFWALVEKDCALTIARPTGAAGVASADKAVAPSDGWIARLCARGQGHVDTDNFFGVSAQLAAMAPMASPPPPGEGVRLHFVADEHQGARLAGRFSAVAAAEIEWEFVVEAPAMGADVEVWCPDVTAVGRSWAMQVIDRSAGREVNLRSGGRYSFTMRPGELQRQMVLRLTQGAGPLTLASLTAQQTSAGGAQVAFALSASATCAVRVMNIAGRTVRVVESGAVRPAGLNQVIWNGRSDFGSRVPAGTYLVVVEAVAEDGTQVRAMGSLSVQR